MRKVTTSIRRRRSVSKCVPVGSEFWEYYRSLDREIKADFSFEVMQATGWGKSTFYTRMKDGTGWVSDEFAAVQSIYKKYKRMYEFD